MTSPDHHHHHHPQHHHLGRLHQFGSGVISSSSMEVARWFNDDDYRRQSAHRHGNGYPTFFQQHPQQRRPDGLVSGHPWPSTVDAAGAAAAPWSLHHGGTPPWTAAGTAGRPGCRGLEAWSVADNTVSPSLTHPQQHEQHQQPYPQSPDGISTSLQMYKYPWMSIIGEFNNFNCMKTLADTIYKTRSSAAAQRFVLLTIFC